MAENLMCKAHKSSSRKYLDRYDDIFRKNGSGSGKEKGEDKNAK